MSASLQIPSIDCSLLILAELDANVEPLVPLVASAHAAAASLGERSMEIILGVRWILGQDQRRWLWEAMQGLENWQLVEDPQARPFPQRWERLRREANGKRLLLLSAGTLPLGPALEQLCTAADADLSMRALRPRFIDGSGQRLSGLQAAGCCLLLDASLWPPGAMQQNPFRGPQLWSSLFASAEHKGLGAEHPEAFAVTAGWAARPLAQASRAMRCHDSKLQRERPNELQRLLIVMLEEEAACAATRAILPLIAATYPGTELRLLCRADQVDQFADAAELSELILAEDPEAGADFASFDLHMLEVIAAEPWQLLIPLGKLLDDPPSTDDDLARSLARQAGIDPALGLRLQERAGKAPEITRLQVVDHARRCGEHHQELCAELAQGGNELDGDVSPILASLEGLAEAAKELCLRSLVQASADRQQLLSEQRWVQALESRSPAYQGASCQTSPQS
jgi:hypothetical protein